MVLPQTETIITMYVNKIIKMEVSNLLAIDAVKSNNHRRSEDFVFFVKFCLFATDLHIKSIQMRILDRLCSYYVI